MTKSILLIACIVAAGGCKASSGLGYSSPDQPGTYDNASSVASVPSSPVNPHDMGSTPTPAPREENSTTNITLTNQGSTASSSSSTSSSTEPSHESADLIRRRLDSGSPPVDAQRVKVITKEGGGIVLRGSVQSQSDKDVVDRVARECAGFRNVDNQIEVEAFAK